MTQDPLVPRSLVYATDIDVLPPDRIVERRGDHLVVRSPNSPAFYWGNLLIFDDAPGTGDAERWERVFAEAFAGAPGVRHMTFAWDRVGAEEGEARSEFVPRGYSVVEAVGLVATIDGLLDHPRANLAAEIRALDPEPGADPDLWSGVIDLQVEGREPGHTASAYRAFTERRLDDRRVRFRANQGAWYVAIDPATGEIAASCGIVVTDGRARFQAVDTALAYRRRGMASRLLVEAARHAARAYGAEHFVITADAHYHALGLYESLGFVRQEHVVGVCHRPPDG